MKTGMRVAMVGAITAVAGASALSGSNPVRLADSSSNAKPSTTTTPIQHLVVIFQENISFDHYFGTYPKAANPPGEPAFTPAKGTPTVNGLSQALLTHNPNLSNPQRLDRSEALTCDENHDYTPEQSAVDSSLQDRYVQNTSSTGGTPPAPQTRAQCLVPPSSTPTPNDYAVMDYYDGNTVTALWNYAQRFSMSDNSFSTTFGPSTPGALNVTSGNTYPVRCAADAGTTAPNGNDPAVYNGNGDVTPCPGGVATSNSRAPGAGTGTVVSDPDQYYDVCSNPNSTAALGGPNVGDLLTKKGISWGWFNGGFQNQGYTPGQPGSSTVATSKCTSAHYNIGAGAANDGKPCTPGAGSLAAYCQKDYSAHHQPFQYFQSTSNPQHLAPTSVASIGHDDQANHQYDLADFWAAANHGNLPAVSYLKAPRFQDGHPHNSDPLDEQTFLVNTINGLQKLDSWKSTAVVIAYDDSDGWYDHATPPITMQSQTPLDTLRGGVDCGNNPKQVPLSDTGKPEQARCGYGPRQPLLVISPFARQNFVDHSITDQASVVSFIEDNWGLGRLGNGSADALAGSLTGLFDFTRRHDGMLLLNPSTGQPAGGGDDNRDTNSQGNQ